MDTLQSGISCSRMSRHHYYWPLLIDLINNKIPPSWTEAQNQEKIRNTVGNYRPLSLISVKTNNLREVKGLVLYSLFYFLKLFSGVFTRS